MPGGSEDADEWTHATSSEMLKIMGFVAFRVFNGSTSGYSALLQGFCCCFVGGEKFWCSEPIQFEFFHVMICFPCGVPMLMQLRLDGSNPQLQPRKSFLGDR